MLTPKKGSHYFFYLVKVMWAQGSSSHHISQLLVLWVNKTVFATLKGKSKNNACDISALFKPNWTLECLLFKNSYNKFEIMLFFTAFAVEWFNYCNLIILHFCLYRYSERALLISNKRASTFRVKKSINAMTSFHSARVFARLKHRKIILMLTLQHSILRQ